MNGSSTPREKLVVIVIIAFCALSVILGVVQLIRSGPDDQVSPPSSATAGFLGSNNDKLAYITLNGMIVESDDDNSSMFSRDSSAMRARKLLYQASRDPDVLGVLLRINSPGGTVGMSQELYKAVLAVRAKKPIVVSMGDVAASGGYYTAAAADKIVANPGTLTASIGVILQSMNLEGLLSGKLGVKAVTVKSGKFKDILSPYRPPSTEDIALIQNIIDKSYHQFLTAVLDGRTKDVTNAQEKAMLVKSITAVADGRVVIGEEAVKVGLVDYLGGLEDAKHVLQELVGRRFRIKNYDDLGLEQYETKFNFWDLFGARIFTPPPSATSLINEKAFLPLSYRYANQPLWVMEQVN